MSPAQAQGLKLAAALVLVLMILTACPDGEPHFPEQHHAGARR